MTRESWFYNGFQVWTRSTRRAQTSASRERAAICACVLYQGAHSDCGGCMRWNPFQPHISSVSARTSIKSNQFLLVSSKFDQNLFITFWVILRTNKQTNKQTNATENITSFGGGNNDDWAHVPLMKVFAFAVLLTDCQECLSWKKSQAAQLVMRFPSPINTLVCKATAFPVSTSASRLLNK